MGLQGIGYKVDIAFVIDATGSMGPIMDKMKAKALTLGDEIKTALKNAGKEVSEMRLRVIDFADYSQEADDAVHHTEFFKVPEQQAEFENAIKNIRYENRGGDYPENALEALFIAMSQSDWVKIKPSEKGRHIIVLMTDAYPLNLQERDGCAGYPSDEFPPDVAALEGIWNEDDGVQGESVKTTQLSKKNHRLVLFAPRGADDAGHTWDQVSQWENTTLTEVSMDDGLDSIDLSSIIAEIVRSC